METLTASYRSDRHVHPQAVNYRILTNEECRHLAHSAHCHILDRAGRIAQVKITSVETWKRKPDVIVHCQYGLYEYFTVRISPDRPNSELIALVEVES
jgi:hypothetical protein